VKHRPLSGKERVGKQENPQHNEPENAILCKHVGHSSRIIGCKKKSATRYYIHVLTFFFLFHWQQFSDFPDDRVQTAARSDNLAAAMPQ
jgi:hypothetical protein